VASTALHINPGRTCTYLNRRQSKDQVPKDLELKLDLLAFFCNACFWDSQQ